MKPIFLFDFDSTFTQVEGLDVLGEQLAAQGRLSHADAAEIRRITDLGMGGEIGFGESLQRRLAILKPEVADLQALIETLHRNVTASFERNAPWLLANSDRIWIVSSGFKEFIAPTVHRFGIEASRVLANEFDFDSRGIGHVRPSNPLAHDQGKPAIVKAQSFSAPVWAIGDGFTDYEIKQSGAAAKFLAFTENVRRDRVVAVADHVLSSLDDLIQLDENA